MKKEEVFREEIPRPYSSFINELEEENNKLKEENWVMKIQVIEAREDRDKLEEENRKLKLHIEAKDKAYTALLKDYEELKEKNKELKAEIEEWLNAVRKSLEK